MTQVAKLTQLDKIQVGDTIYSKVIFNVKQTQAVPPSHEEFIILDNGSEFRFYTDGTIFFRQGTTTPVLLFNGQDWIQNEVLVNGTVSQLYLHQDPVNGANNDEVNSHPHVNYGWFDKAQSASTCPEFHEKESYENCGMPNEQYLVCVKNMMVMIAELTRAYTDMRDLLDEFINDADLLTYIKAWYAPDWTGWQVEWLKQHHFADWALDNAAMWTALKADFDHREQIVESYYTTYVAQHGTWQGRTTYMPDKYVFDWDNLAQDGKPNIILNPRHLYYYPNATIDTTEAAYQAILATRNAMTAQGA